MTCSGNVFQMRAPATGKARKPTEVNRTAGTIRSSEVEDRSLWREGTSATRTNCRRYCRSRHAPIQGASRLPMPKRFDLERWNLIRWHGRGRICFLGVSHDPVSRGRGRQHPPKFRDLLYMRSMRNNSRVLHGDPAGYEESFFDYECWRAICLRLLV